MGREWNLVLCFTSRLGKGSEVGIFFFFFDDVYFGVFAFFFFVKGTSRAWRYFALLLFLLFV